MNFLALEKKKWIFDICRFDAIQKYKLLIKIQKLFPIAEHA